MKELVKKETVTFRYIGKGGDYSMYTITRNADEQIVGDVSFNTLNNQFVLNKTTMPITAVTLRSIAGFVDDLNAELVEAQ